MHPAHARDEKLSSVSSDLGASSADYPPTQAQIAVHEMLRQQLEASSGSSWHS